MDELNRKLLGDAEVIASQYSIDNYTESGIQSLESIIDQDGFREAYNASSESEQSMILTVLGVFLGRCMCETLGGYWKIDEELGHVVECKNDVRTMIVSPFSMVKKFVHLGQEKSLLMICRAIKMRMSAPKDEHLVQS